MESNNDIIEQHINNNENQETSQRQKTKWNFFSNLKYYSKKVADEVMFVSEVTIEWLGLTKNF